jgi:hypothetical protein
LVWVLFSSARLHIFCGFEHPLRASNERREMPTAVVRRHSFRPWAFVVFSIHLISVGSRYHSLPPDTELTEVRFF